MSCRRKCPRPPDPPVIFSKIPFRLKTPIQISDDHVLTPLDVKLNLSVNVLAQHGKLNQCDIPFMVAFLHQRVEAVVRLLFRLSLSNQYANQIMLKS